jgi:hypothetical protein
MLIVKEKIEMFNLALESFIALLTKLFTSCRKLIPLPDAVCPEGKRGILNWRDSTEYSALS